MNPVENATHMLQDKRDGLELAVLTQTQAGEAIVRTFEDMLSDYMLQFLNPELGDQEALWMRAKAIGLVETLTKMGLKISSVTDAPIRRPAKRVVAQSLNTSAY